MATRALAAPGFEPREDEISTTTPELYRWATTQVVNNIKVDNATNLNLMRHNTSQDLMGSTKINTQNIQEYGIPNMRAEGRLPRKRSQKKSKCFRRFLNLLVSL